MATNTNIGNLSAILTADASQLVGELNRAATAMEQTSQSVTVSSTKMGNMIERMTGRLLLYAAFRDVSNEIKDVINNIEHIPGISSEVLQSVTDLRDEMHGLKNDIDWAVAGGLSFFDKWYTSAKIAAQGYLNAMGVMHGFTQGALYGVSSEIHSPDQIAADKDPNYDAKVAAAREKLADATHKAALAGKDLSVQYADLIQQEQALLAVSKDTNTFTTLQILQDKTKAVQLDGQAKEKLKQIDDQYTRAEESLTKAYTKNQEAGGNLFAVRQQLYQQEQSLQEQLDALGPVNLADAANTEKRTKLTKELTTATREEATTQEKINRLMREHSAALAAVDQATFGAGEKHKGLQQQLADYQARVAAIDKEMSGLNPSGSSGDLERENQLLKQKAQLIREVGQIEKQMKQPELEMTNAFISGFQTMGNALTEFVMTGHLQMSKFLDQIAQQIISTFIKLAVINPLINGIFGGVSGFTTLPAFFSIAGFASGGTPPVGAPSIVGENGPELFVPKTQGTIIPNNQLSSGKSGNHYYIDARGADAGQISVLKSMIQALNASVEDRAVSAVLMQQRRRGTMGNSLLGYS